MKLTNKMRGDIVEKNENLSKPMTVLLLSDRLTNWAHHLSKYLSNQGIQVLGIAENKREVFSILDSGEIDYLIIVGYLKESSTYEVVEELKKEISFKPVQWAILDAVIGSYCSQFNISLRFDRRLPYEEFVEFLNNNLEVQ